MHQGGHIGGDKGGKFAFDTWVSSGSQWRCLSAAFDEEFAMKGPRSMRAQMLCICGFGSLSLTLGQIAASGCVTSVQAG